jgi:hypothetical protein
VFARGIDGITDASPTRFYCGGTHLTAIAANGKR